MPPNPNVLTRIIIIGKLTDNEWHIHKISLKNTVCHLTDFGRKNPLEALIPRNHKKNPCKMPANEVVITSNYFAQQGDAQQGKKKICFPIS